jgi:cell division protease FtsH
MLLISNIHKHHTQASSMLVDLSPEAVNSYEFNQPDKQQATPGQQKHADRGPVGQPPQPAPWQLFLNTLVWLLVISSLIHFGFNIKDATQTTISYSLFKQELVADNIARVSVKDREITGQFRDGVIVPGEGEQRFKTFKTFLPSFGDERLLELLEENKVEIESVSTSTPVWLTVITSIAPWLILIAFFVYSGRLMRRNLMGKEGGFGFSKSRARHFDANNISTRYTDVAGLDNAKRDLQEIIDYLKNPDRYLRLGAKIPRGILMMGPPGCGKTLLAKATAGEAGVPFFSVSGSEFIEMFVGVGASRVRDMFGDARKQAPALIFIDEIDSVGRVRGTGLGGGNDEREQTLNQVLAEMDGFSSDEVVVVLAATNRPDVLDPALLRPGRFDRKLVLELPGRKARQEIIAVHTRSVPLAGDVDMEAIAAQTVGFSGADLKNLVNEAALWAARNRAEKVCQQDFDLARDKVVLGNPLSELLAEGERERVAYHEAGHALATFYSDKADPINKVSIIPRGRSLGMTEQMPTEDRRNYTQDYLEEMLCIMLGGRCAEQLHFDYISSGAADDLKKVTDLARKMITQWGMSERIGPVNLQRSEEHPFLGRDIAEPKEFSEHYAQIVDEEVSALINRCEEKCRARLQEYNQDLVLLAKSLLERETLSGDQIRVLLTGSPGVTENPA